MSGMATVASVRRNVYLGQNIASARVEDLATQRQGKSSSQRGFERYLENLDRSIARLNREAYAKLGYRQRTLSLALLRQERWQKKLAENDIKLKEVGRSIAATENRRQLEVLRARRSRIKETIHRNREELARATQAVRKAENAVRQSEEAGKALGQVPQRE